MPDAIPVLITRGAEEDLRAIYRRRLAQRGASGEDSADALLAQLVGAIEALATYPLRGPSLLNFRHWESRRSARSRFHLTG